MPHNPHQQHLWLLKSACWLHIGGFPSSDCRPLWKLQSHPWKLTWCFAIGGNKHPPNDALFFLTLQDPGSSSPVALLHLKEPDALIYVELYVTEAVCPLCRIRLGLLLYPQPRSIFLSLSQKADP